ncbi:MAG: ribonuclease T [Rhodobacteraceae bacterium]|jgi:ribonuclease T2|nr:ribonuclease T [Paracoccaceae bacterium]
MRAILAVLALGLIAATGARAERFDYYVLALSWMPGWCALEGSERGDGRCAGGGAGFALHGLWPQHEQGWPEYCRSPHPDATRAETAAAAVVYGSSGLAWYQWRKHGSCSGLSARDYFRAAARAAGLLRLPATLGQRGTGRMSGAEVVREILALNPGLAADSLVVACRSGRLTELRLCLTQALAPRACAADVRARDCGGRLLETRVAR